MDFWDVHDTVELLGRFGIFWGFVFSRRFRAFVIDEWGKQGALGKAFRLMEGVVNALIGLSPFVAAGVFAWWLW